MPGPSSSYEGDPVIATRSVPPVSPWNPRPRCTASELTCRGCAASWPATRSGAGGPLAQRLSVPGLPVPHGLRHSQETRLHRPRRHRCYTLGVRLRTRPWTPAGHGRVDRRGAGPAATFCHAGGPARRLDHRRLHVRPLRHRRPGEMAYTRRRPATWSSVLDNGTTADDRTAGAPRDRPHRTTAPRTSSRSRASADGLSASRASP